MATGIGNFEILEKIAAGGMGVIYKARQTTLDRLVVIKELKSTFQDDTEVVARFEQEAKAVARLQHENIINVIEFWHKKGSYYFAMEYVDGADLAKIIGTSGPLPLHIGLIIASLIARALGYAHDHGIVHRDLKPSNILVSWDGRVKLVDFGIAHIEEGLGGKDLTRVGSSMGTPAYMSPEQTDGKPADPSSDVWSFGCVLYEIFSGTRAFDAHGKTSMLENIRNGNRTPPTDQYLRSVPWGLRRMINRCLKIKPGKRPSTNKLMAYLVRLAHKKNHGRDDAAVLKAFFEDKRGQAQADVKTEVLRPDREKSKKTSRTAWAVTGILLVMMLVGVGYALFGRDVRSFVRHVPPGQEGFGGSALSGTTAGPVSGHAGQPLSQASLSVQGTAQATPQASLRRFIQPAPAPVEKHAAEPLPGGSAVVPSAGKPVTPASASVPPKAVSGPRTSTLPVPVVHATGYIRVVAAPWAEVYIDGRHVGVTPTARRFPVTAGRHTVLFKNPYYGSVERTIEVPDRGDTVVRVTMNTGRKKR